MCSENNKKKRRGNVCIKIWKISFKHSSYIDIQLCVRHPDIHHHRNHTFLFPFASFWRKKESLSFLLLYLLVQRAFFLKFISSFLYQRQNYVTILFSLLSYLLYKTCLYRTAHTKEKKGVNKSGEKLSILFSKIILCPLYVVSFWLSSCQLCGGPKGISDEAKRVPCIKFVIVRVGLCHMGQMLLYGCFWCLFWSSYVPNKDTHSEK